MAVSVVFRDWMLTGIAVAMLGLCIVPAIHRPTIGIVENLLIAILLLGFIRFYDYTLKKSGEAVRPNEQDERVKRPRSHVIEVK